jgi:hypothetical protein
MPLRAPGDGWVEGGSARRLGLSVTEEETYLEHRSALDATLFRRRSAATVTFELESGSLTMLEDLLEGLLEDLPEGPWADAD